MKSIKMIFATLMLVASTCAVQATNINYNKKLAASIVEYTETMSRKNALTADSTGFYSIDLNKNFERLSNMLELNPYQSHDLFDTHKIIMKELDNLDNIADVAQRERMFNAIITAWRQKSYYAIVLNSDSIDEYTMDDVRKKFRIYWSIVNATVNNRGILGPDGKLNQNTNSAIA